MAAVPVPDPARRVLKRQAPQDEIQSPVRGPDYVPPARRYRTISPDQAVQVWGGEWDRAEGASA
jgi:peptide/nickel transport system ATP-binding protein